MTTQQPEALDLADWLEAVGGGPSAKRCAALLREQHARITELESQLAQRFDAADVETASAQGFLDGVASLSANAGEPRNAIDRDDLIDAIAQGLNGTWHCTRAWEAWHVGTMSRDDFEPVNESETPTEIADAVLALIAAPPAAQAEGWKLVPVDATDDMLRAIRNQRSGGRVGAGDRADWAAWLAAAPTPAAQAEECVPAVEREQERIAFKDAHRHVELSVIAAPAQPGLMDAYVGAREDLSIWKRLALEAEATVRNFVREANSPTFMGDPASDECHHGDAFQGAT